MGEVGAVAKKWLVRNLRKRRQK